MSAPLLCLASESPRRRELLAQLGVAFVARGADLDETPRAAERPADYVQRMAAEKALALRGRGETLPVLAADTTVVIDEQLCGKPADETEALTMLARLSGRTHQVLTAVALLTGGAPQLRLSTSEVSFRVLTREECRAYWASGEPRDKAGGYAIQGRGAVFVAHLSGSYSGVVGLPLFETAQLLERAGIACPGAA